MFTSLPPREGETTQPRLKLTNATNVASVTYRAHHANAVFIRTSFANFLELRKAEVPRIHLLGNWMHKEARSPAGSRQSTKEVVTPSSALTSSLVLWRVSSMARSWLFHGFFALTLVLEAELLVAAILALRLRGRKDPFDLCEGGVESFAEADSDVVGK